jgi:hypothetical protein
MISRFRTGTHIAQQHSHGTVDVACRNVGKPSSSIPNKKKLENEVFDKKSACT